MAQTRQQGGGFTFWSNGQVPAHLEYLLPWLNGGAPTAPNTQVATNSTTSTAPANAPRPVVRKKSTAPIGGNVPPSPTPSNVLNTMAGDSSWIGDMRRKWSKKTDSSADRLWSWPRVWAMQWNNKTGKKLVKNGMGVDIDWKTGKPVTSTTNPDGTVAPGWTPWANPGTLVSSTTVTNPDGTTTTTNGTNISWSTSTTWTTDTSNMNPYQKQMLDYQTKVADLQSQQENLPDQIRSEFPTSLTKWEYNAILNNRTKQLQDQVADYSRKFETAKWYYEANRGEQDRIASMLNRPETLSQMTVWQLDDLKKSGYLNDQYYNIYKGQIVWSLVDGLQKVAAANRKPLTEQEIGIIKTQFEAWATPQQIMSKLYTADADRFNPSTAYDYKTIDNKLYAVNPNDPTDVTLVAWSAWWWSGGWGWPIQKFTLNNGKTITANASAWNAIAQAINNIGINIDYGNQYRSADDQMKLYGKWRTQQELIDKWVPPQYAQPSLKKVTWTLDSEHMKGNAFDVIPPKWVNQAEYFANLDKQMAQYWLTRPAWLRKSDPGHYEYTGGWQWWWDFDQTDISVFNSMTPTARKSAQDDPLYNSFVNKKKIIMKDRNADINDVIDYSMWWTNINQTQETQLTKFSQALDQLSSISEKIKTVNTWPIVGILKSKNPYDTKAQELKAMMTSLIPNLARWVYGEVWVLTDADVELYSKTIPNLKSTKAVNDAILSMTLKAIWSWYKRKLQSMAAWWFDVSWYWWLYDELTWKANAMLSNTGWWSTTTGGNRWRL